MEQTKIFTFLKIVIAIAIILALSLSIFHLSEGILLPEKNKGNEIGKYKDILIPIISNPSSFGHGREVYQEKNDYQIIRYDLYLLNTETGEIIPQNK
jgi:hypothetical protein